jgi:hypothetical protein
MVAGKQPGDPLFTREDGSPVRDFRGSWKLVTAAAGIPSLHFHDLRRTAVRNLRRAGVAEKVCMEIGGWETSSVFHRYGIVDNADVSDAMKRLENSRLERTPLRAAEPAKTQTGKEHVHFIHTGVRKGLATDREQARKSKRKAVKKNKL